MAAVTYTGHFSLNNVCRYLHTKMVVCNVDTYLFMKQNADFPVCLSSSVDWKAGLVMSSRLVEAPEKWSLISVCITLE